MCSVTLSVLVLPTQVHYLLLVWSFLTLHLVLFCSVAGSMAWAVLWISPHTAAEDAFPSKPAIDFLNVYFCSACDRLEVSFLVKLLQSCLWLRLHWNGHNGRSHPTASLSFHPQHCLSGLQTFSAEVISHLEGIYVSISCCMDLSFDFFM